MSLVDLFAEQKEKEGNKINGVVIGIVTNNKDPEGMGRVKIKFPWRDSEDESDWARVATMMAGKERGSFFLPEVDDEVLVAFGEGDFKNPYVIGTLWNGKDKPPETNSDGKNNIRKIKSRSGHEIVFDDSSGKEKLEIHTNAGHTILMDDASGGEKIEIKDKSGNNSVVIDSAGNSISVKSSMELKIESQKIEIKSGGMMNLEASGVLTIKGSLVKIN